MKISCVIVTYNRFELLKECVHNILNQTYPVSEIVIVNNNSIDETDEYLQKLSSENDLIKSIFLKENIGGAGGFNVGLKNVSEDIDYVLLIDDDAIIEKDFFERIMENIEGDVLAYSGTVKTNERIITTHRTRLIDKTFLKRKDVPEEEYGKDSFYYDLSTFCGLVISRSLIDKIGLPMKDYFIWQDDSEYSLRIIRYSKIKNINQAIINHKTTLKDKKSHFDWRNYYGYRNFIDLGRKHSNHPLVFLFSRYSHHISRMIFYWILSKLNVKNESYFHNCYLLNQQVILDSLHHKLGISKIFYPGKEM